MYSILKIGHTHNVAPGDVQVDKMSSSFLPLGSAPRQLETMTNRHRMLQQSSHQSQVPIFICLIFLFFSIQLSLCVSLAQIKNKTVIVVVGPFFSSVVGVANF